MDDGLGNVALTARPPDVPPPKIGCVLIGLGDEFELAEAIELSCLEYPIAAPSGFLHDGFCHTEVNGGTGFPFRCAMFDQSNADLVFIRPGSGQIVLVNIGA